MWLHQHLWVKHAHHVSIVKLASFRKGVNGMLLGGH